MQKMMVLAAMLAMVFVVAVPAMANHNDVSQSFEQESESGDIDQSFDISGGGDNGSQCANVTGDVNTGNLQNTSGSLQFASDIEEIEQEDIGSDLSVSGTSPVTCEQQVNQAAAAG